MKEHFRQYFLPVFTGFCAAWASVGASLTMGECAERLLPYDPSAWYGSAVDFIDDYNLPLLMIFSSFIGFALMLICEKRIQRHIPVNSHSKISSVTFRALFWLGGIFAAGTALALSMMVNGGIALELWTVFLIIACDWLMILLFALLMYLVQFIVKKARKDTSCHIAYGLEMLLALLFFTVVFITLSL